MLVIPFATLDGYYAVFKVYVITFQQDRLGCPYLELYSKREKHRQCHALDGRESATPWLYVVASVKEAFQFIVCKRMRRISPRHRP